MRKDSQGANVIRYNKFLYNDATTTFNRPNDSLYRVLTVFEPKPFIWC